jgi:hypothetical protein
VLASSLLFAMFGVEREQSLDKVFVCAEVGERETVEGGAKIDETLLCGIREYA